MGKNKHIEENNQNNITLFFRLNGGITIDTDVMSGLKFVNTPAKRIGFIAGHNRKGYTKGQPDLIVLINGQVLFIECKSDTGRQSPEQKIVQEKITQQGFEYVIFRDVNDAEKWLENHKKHQK